MQDFRALSYADPATDTRADDGDTVYAHERSADRFVPLRVKRVIGETRDAISIVLDVPEQSAHQFRYRAGQFLTLLVCIDGQEYQRCYSMSSSPAAGEDLRITVKRDRDGVVSNWLNDTTAPGHTLNAAPPRGRFVLSDTDRPLIAFAGGSGITPVFSLLRSALASTTRDARLFYANRTRDSVIFDAALASLQEQHPGRFTLRHHLDEDSGMSQLLRCNRLSRRTRMPTFMCAGRARSWTRWRPRCGPPERRPNVCTSSAFRQRPHRWSSRPRRAPGAPKKGPSSW